MWQIFTVRFLPVFLLVLISGREVWASDELLHVGHGTLPIVISAPHGGRLSLNDVPVRTGKGLKTGPSGFFTGRDTGTEELAELVVEQLRARLEQGPSFVISRVHRRFVDFNRPVDIAVEHPRARVVYDAYHNELGQACRQIYQGHGRGLLLDIHGQGSSAVTVYRGTKNGLTVTSLRTKFGESAHSGEFSLFGVLKAEGWTVFPDPFEGREQSGFTGGFIVQNYGSHRANGIDAIQLEFGSQYRTASAREQTAEQLVAAICDYVDRYLPDALSKSVVIPANQE